MKRQRVTQESCIVKRKQEDIFRKFRVGPALRESESKHRIHRALLIRPCLSYQLRIVSLFLSIFLVLSLASFPTVYAHHAQRRRADTESPTPPF